MVGRLIAVPIFLGVLDDTVHIRYASDIRAKAAVYSRVLGVDRAYDILRRRGKPSQSLAW